jgi:phosphotransferase system enzyme I (PtsI)
MLGQVTSRAEEGLRASGSPASPGIAMGEALFRGSHELTVDSGGLPFQGAEVETRRVADAFEATRKEVLRIQEAAEREATEEHALIFSSHLLLLNDSVLMERIAAAVREGQAARPRFLRLSTSGGSCERRRPVYPGPRRGHRPSQRGPAPVRTNGRRR